MAVSQRIERFCPDGMNADQHKANHTWCVEGDELNSPSCDCPRDLPREYFGPEQLGPSIDTLAERAVLNFRLRQAHAARSDNSALQAISGKMENVAIGSGVEAIEDALKKKKKKR